MSKHRDHNATIDGREEYLRTNASAVVADKEQKIARLKDRITRLESANRNMKVQLARFREGDSPHLLETTCHWCGKSSRGKSLTLDHVHPRGAGGSNSSDNLVRSCYACNRSRGVIFEITLGRLPSGAKIAHAKVWFDKFADKDWWLAPKKTSVALWFEVWRKGIIATNDIFPHQTLVVDAANKERVHGVEP